MKKTLLSSFTLRAFMLVMTFLGAANAAWADEVTVTKEMTAIATANNWTTSSGSAAVCYTSFNLDDNITISTSGEANCGSFWGTDWRLYQAKSGNVTITAAENCTLKSITITYSNKNGGQLDGLDSDVATELSGSSVTYNITNSGSATNGQVKITKISVTYENGGTQTDTRQASDLTVSSESIEIDLSVPMDVRLVATTESTGAVTFTGYDESIITVTSINEKAIKVSPQAVGSTSIIVSVAADDNYKAGSKTVAVTISDSDNPEPGTKDTPYTVAEAVTFINTLGSSTSSSEVYVKGIISQVDSYNSNYKSLTYWISDDGSTTNQMQVYSGKGLESADFASKEDIAVGDVVIVCGKVKNYQGTPEFDKNNYLVSYTKSEKQDAGLAFESTTNEFEIELGSTFTAPTLQNPHNLAVTYSSNNENVATVNENGVVTIKAAGVTTITAKSEANDTYKAGEASYKLVVTDSNAPGQTKDNPYTVAAAIAFINTLGSEISNTVYVKGKVSLVDSYNSTYKSITYWISDDGTTQNQLQVYSGKGLENADFASKDDLSIGDEVIVCGNVKMYTKNGASTPEFDKENYLVYLKQDTRTTPEFWFMDATGSKLSDLEINVGETKTIQVAANITDVRVAINYEDDFIKCEDGVITAKAAGTTELTINIDVQETTEHKGGTFAIMLPVTVIDPTKPQETITFAKLGYTNSTEVEAAQGQYFTVTFDKGTNSNAPAYYDTGEAIRVYGGSSFTVSSASTITKIALAFGSGDKDNDIITDKETYANGTWTGSSNEVVFTISGTNGHRRIASITVEFAEAPTAIAEAAVVSEYGFATFNSTKALDFTNAGGIKAYIATLATEGESDVIFTRVYKVPANTGLLLVSEAGADAKAFAKTLEEGAETDAVEGNLFVAVSEPTNIPSEADGMKNYILTTTPNLQPLGFYLAGGKDIAAGKAYIQVPANVEVKSFNLPGMTSTVENLRANATQNAIFNLAGHRVNKAVKGIYVVNGKKVVMK